MEESILVTIKKMLGLVEDYTPFDTEIIVHINSILGVLAQEGVGKDGFFITDSGDSWSDFIGDSTKLEMVKSYVYMRVRLLFDPPTGSATESFNNAIKELEWRMYTQENQYYP